VLLLNTVLTVRAGEAHSHQGKGWELFTDAILSALARKPDPLVFVLWGKSAQEKAGILRGAQHLVLTAAHPSPLSARNGFFGSRPFSTINRFLTQHGAGAVDWQPRK
jgi:uracil-DNA glycosylase